MRAYLEILRPVNGLMAAVAVVLGAAIAGVYGAPVLWAAVAAFLVSGGGMVINDYFDVEIDERNRPERPIPSGRVTRVGAAAYSAVLFTLGIGITFFLPPFLLLLASVNSLIEVLYAWRLKATPLIGNLLVSWLVGSTYLFGALLAPDLSSAVAPALLGGVAFLANLAREIYKTATDYEGDRKGGARTIAVLLGPGKSKRLGDAVAVLASVVSVLPYIYQFLGPVYMAVQSIAILVFLSGVASQSPEAGKRTKYGMLIGIAAVALEVAAVTFLV